MKNSNIKTLYSQGEYDRAIQDAKMARFDSFLYYAAIFLLSGTVIGGIIFLTQ